MPAASWPTPLSLPVRRSWSLPERALLRSGAPPLCQPARRHPPCEQRRQMFAHRLQPDLRAPGRRHAQPLASSRCHPKPQARHSIRDLETRSPAPPTATTAGSRPAAPRSSTTSAWLAQTHGFPGLKGIGKVTATREQNGRATTTATRYYLLSRRLTAARFLEVVRTHWQIENALHCVMDVVLDVDQARARKDHAPESSPACAASHSTSCAPTAPRARPAARSSAPAGTTPSSSTSA